MNALSNKVLSAFGPNYWMKVEDPASFPCCIDAGWRNKLEVLFSWGMFPGYSSYACQSSNRTGSLLIFTKCPTTPPLLSHLHSLVTFPFFSPIHHRRCVKTVRTGGRRMDGVGEAENNICMSNIRKQKHWENRQEDFGAVKVGGPSDEIVLINVCVPVGLVVCPPPPPPKCEGAREGGGVGMGVK